jgi:alkanesulfonate monooxygenase SsuD/methylene tetrahydromethanopterin reductase-like flavin-dependent oxidoreductase (luciferase family)
MDGGAFSFGLFDILQVDPDRPTGETLREHLGHAELADQLGFDYIFFAERHFMPLYRAATPGLLLARLSATTTRARLGVMAYTLALHNPALLAEEISALDHLTGGRLEVGVGLGHRPQELAALGLPVEHRQAIFMEALVMLHGLWGGEPYSMDGGLFHLRDVLVDAPFQRPNPPLWYAGSDPDAAGWAARNGLSLAIGFQPDDALRAPAVAFRAELPDGTSSKLAIMRHVYVAESDELARDEMVADLVRIGAELAVNPRGTDAASTPPTEADAERQRADLLAKQVIVAGSPATVAGELARSMQTLNADVFLANAHLAGVDDGRVRRTLTLLANEVFPMVRSGVD